MSARVQFARGLAIISVQGTLGPREVVRIIRQLHAGYPGTCRLWDWRQADMTPWSAEQMRQVQRQIARLEQDTPVRAAAVVDRDADFGLGRMFEALVPTGHPVTYRVFRDAARAEAWLLGGR